MKPFEMAFQDLIDDLQSAGDPGAFRSIGDRVAQKLGFQWIAYLGFKHESRLLISTYPRDWTNHYFDQSYYKIDPVIRRAKRERDMFGWDGPQGSEGSMRAQKKFFGEASEFGIQSGITIPIRAGFENFAAFTLGSQKSVCNGVMRSPEAREALQLIALYFHTHAEINLVDGAISEKPSPLSQREAHCLSWAARGKTMAETAAIVGITARTVQEHIKNARTKLKAENVTQAAVIASRSRWIA